MGRIKTTFVKTIGKDLFEKYDGQFFDDFSKNKAVVDKLIIIKSKKMRNIVTGYLTSLKKQQLRKEPGY
ncbi:MAG: 30S ribosomal protein S17e [Candidatus Aenigmarchaeota archaeon]|nr:30S ribosomal protein S17e [Candidatus Aenigmarchaeota archaeon]